MTRWLGWALVALWVAANPPARGQDEELERQAVELLQQYLRIDTTNPPGNERPAAQFWYDRFRAAGLEAHLFESAPGRGGVWARLAGHQRGEAVVLLHHLDVVPADPEQWEHPPFAGVEKGGFVYGRGALDAKGLGTVQALALLTLHRRGIVPPRDVIFLATPDEEMGGRLGAGWFVEQRLQELGPIAGVLNEGGHIRPAPNGKLAFEVAVGEKAPLWVRLVASGKAGHGSVPPQETAVTRLLQALVRLQEWERPLHVTDEVQAYFAALAPLQLGPQQAAFADLRRALEDAPFRAEFTADPTQHALVRDTCTPTVLRASQKTNVIPAEASAEIDCRLLPGTDSEAFLRALSERVADLGVRVEVLLHFAPSRSPTGTVLFRAFDKLAQREQGVVVPSVLAGFTDSHYFREKGIPAYGFAPFVLTDAERRTMHGTNERISRANLRQGAERMMALIQAMD